jgi:hypothetical protein
MQFECIRRTSDTKSAIAEGSPPYVIRVQPNLTLHLAVSIHLCSNERIECFDKGTQSSVTLQCRILTLYVIGHDQFFQLEQSQHLDFTSRFSFESADTNHIENSSFSYGSDILSLFSLSDYPLIHLQYIRSKTKITHMS